MKLIVPMAGRGTRLRPHTFTTPKPLLPIGGKAIVQRLIEDITGLCKGEKIDEIAFVIGDFGTEVERQLAQIASSLGAKASIYYQEHPLGTAHAILCAKNSMKGNCLIAFADTLFFADFVIDTSLDGVIWVKQVPNPTAYGVVTLDKENNINNMVEKPEQFVSDLAIIGIYYIQNSAELISEIQYLMANDIKTKGEYQLTDALYNMVKKGAKFKTGEVREWVDCGNKEALLDTNAKILAAMNQEELAKTEANIIDSIIIPPCYIGKGAVIQRSVIGPNVAISCQTQIKHSVISNSIIRENARIVNASIDNGIIGANASFIGTPKSVNLGDYSSTEQ